MNRFHQIIFSFGLGIALILFPFIPQAKAATPNVNTRTTMEFFELGVDALQSDKYERALADFSKAIELDATRAAAYSNRCLVYIQLGNYEKASEDCTIALKFNPNNAEASLNRGMAYFRLGNYPAAISEYNRAIEQQPDDLRAYYNRGLVRFEIRDFQGALNDYNQAISKSDGGSDSRLVEVYNDRGLAELMLGSVEDAIADFSLAIHLDASNHRAFYNRACACHRMGNLLAAIRDFTAALQLDPNHAQAYVNRGIIRHELGLQQAALSDLKTASKHFHEQGNRVAYQQTVALIERLQLLLQSWEDAIADSSSYQAVQVRS